MAASFHIAVGLSMAYSAILIPDLESPNAELRATKTETAWISKGFISYNYFSSNCFNMGDCVPQLFIVPEFITMGMMKIPKGSFHRRAGGVVDTHCTFGFL